MVEFAGLEQSFEGSRRSFHGDKLYVGGSGGGGIIIVVVVG